MKSNSGEEPRAQAFCRTLIADRDGYNDTAIYECWLDFLSFWIYSIGGRNPSFLTELIPKERQSLCQKRSDKYREALELSARKFFVTQNGYIGLGPGSIRKKDLVCVLLGGRVPFILRRMSTSSSHILLGECYAHGIMKGEALEGRKEEIGEFFIA